MYLSQYCFKSIGGTAPAIVFGHQFVTGSGNFTSFLSIAQQFLCLFCELLFSIGDHDILAVSQR